MNSAPLVSIVIPAYNSRFFRRALLDALAQTWQPLEVVVCDDSQGDEIEQIVQQLTGTGTATLRYVRNPQRQGFVGNLLVGLNEARGSFIKFLCDDDRLFPAAVARQAQVLDKHDDVSLVLAQRYFCDPDDIQLPARIENCPLAEVSALFYGADLLSVFDISATNFLGGFTSSLMRRSDVAQILPALREVGDGFTALVDFALYICMLKRGNMVMLNDVLSAERLHPERFSRQQAVIDRIDGERDWLKKMLKARAGEDAPDYGWVRFVPLAEAHDGSRVWQELPLSRMLGDRQAVLPWRVGSDSESFAGLYQQWLSYRTLFGAERARVPDNVAAWPVQPKLVAVVLDPFGSSASLALTLESLEAQLYPPELILVLSASCEAPVLHERVFTLPAQPDWVTQLNTLVPQLQRIDWLYLLRAGDRLIDCALLIVAERIASSAQVLCIYSDEGALLKGESAQPVFKPDFNLDLLRSYPYVGRVLAFQLEAITGLGGFDPRYGELAPHDAIWRLFEARGAVVHHVAEILVESQLAFDQWLKLDQVVEQSAEVLKAHLLRLGVEHRLHETEQPLINQVQYLSADQPLVSVVIVHKDQLAALQRCIETMLTHTAYGNYEVLIVDHGSLGADVRAWLADMQAVGGDKLRVVHYAGQGNAADIRNYAASLARGDYLLMLSVYAVVANADWLDELLNHGRRSEVGVVGGKLFSAEGYVLQAGLILGYHGPAGPAFFGEPLNAAGHLLRLKATQNLSAVGPECLLVRRALFEQLGGLDSTGFTGSLSEVDLCLRARQSGYLVVWAPRALLAVGALPVAEQQRDKQLQINDQQAFYLRWLPTVARDPAYNHNLRLTGSFYSLEPGLKKGWNPYSSRRLPNVLAIPVNSTAVGHYRVAQPFLELEADGRIEGRLSYDSPSIIDLERQSPDVIIVQCRYSQASIDEILKLKTYSNARRIYELDDYVISVPKKNGHLRSMPRNMESMVRLGTSLCDRVVVSTTALADALSGLHQDIRVVPNMLASQLWSSVRSQRQTSRKPRVGWGGGTSHAGDLDIIADVVRELADQVEWVFFGMCPEALKPYVHEFHPAVGLHAYPAKLASLNLDLALAPLEYHIFNDCKSNLRLLEYGACGYPVICSDTRAYEGYLPCTRIISNSTEEWLEAIRMHLADPVASYRMGDDLKEIVMRDYMLRGDNLQHWVNGWLAD
ncbi:glycosyltransferase [Pseudomonas sp. LP_7_YM]|uniref:glycosyltransferase n=1 Tax=Pseudomonas sp. LP_7_YM TaxID=2485137 RepID=UPI00105E3545|nr:glycosyltransferase [Pseudomonas sp. LP_7_YM]TDV68007.1 glycosyl transferase family 2 [Pseudomonas sp. LP_7_YM]